MENVNCFKLIKSDIILIYVLFRKMFYIKSNKKKCNIDSS